MSSVHEAVPVFLPSELEVNWFVSERERIGSAADAQTLACPRKEWGSFMPRRDLQVLGSTVGWKWHHRPLCIGKHTTNRRTTTCIRC
jgi:hypothetical protein